MTQLSTNWEKKHKKLYISGFFKNLKSMFPHVNHMSKFSFKNVTIINFVFPAISGVKCQKL